MPTTGKSSELVVDGPRDSVEGTSFGGLSFVIGGLLLWSGIRSGRSEGSGHQENAKIQQVCG
jgi:hypothetical protein